MVETLIWRLPKIAKKFPCGYGRQVGCLSTLLLSIDNRCKFLNVRKLIRVPANFFNRPIPPLGCQQNPDLLISKPESDNLGRISSHHRIGRNVFHDNRTRSHDCSCAYPYPAGNNYVSIPQLGMVDYRDGKSFCIADLPGIIEGAAEGKGLGHRFLRHIERNSILLFLIPADCADHKKEFEILVNELEQYNAEMLQKDFVIAISKSDMLDDELKTAIAKELPQKIPHIFISSVTGKGLPELKDMLWSVMNQQVQK